jgi:hypothetical protein
MATALILAGASNSAEAHFGRNVQCEFRAIGDAAARTHPEELRRRPNQPDGGVCATRACSTASSSHHFFTPVVPTSGRPPVEGRRRHPARTERRGAVVDAAIADSDHVLGHELLRLPV